MVTGHEREYTSTGTPPWKSPVALSVLLHLLVMGIALAGWSWTSPDHEPPPRSISARLITQQEPEPSPVVEPVDQPDRDYQRRAEEKREAEAEKQRQQEEARRAAEQKAKEEAQRRQAEQERKQQQAQAREKEAQQAREAEAARQKAEAEEKARERRKAEEEKRQQEEARRKAEEEKRRQEEQRKLEEQRKREEAERRQREEEARKEAERKRLEAERRLREQQLEAQAERAAQAREEEARLQQQAAAARARETQMLSESEKYQALIRERLSQAWYPPSSATEEMTARLQITLLPTGELAGVKLVSSSGNTAFDNSALSAVQSLNRYPIPDERDTFERYFRQFTIEFNPRRLK